MYKQVRYLWIGSLSLALLSINVAAEEAPEHKSLWSGEVSAGANANRGNTEDAALAGMFKAKRKTPANELAFKAQADYASSDDKMTTQRYYGLGRYSFNFGAGHAWFNFYSVEADHDRFANINWRVTPSSGIGYWFANTETWTAKAELGMGWESTEFRDGTADRNDPIIVTKASFEKTLSKGAKLNQDFSFWPSLGDFGEYRLRAETAITTPLIMNIALRLGILDEYLSNPAAGTRQNDLRLTSSLVYTF